MKIPTLRPGQKITYLAYPEDTRYPQWMDAEIEDVLASQVTYIQHGTTRFLLNSDYGITWRLT